MKKKLRKSEYCLNCGKEVKDYNYCPNCGQLNTHKQLPVRVFIKETLGDLFTFDSKFFRSFVPLIKKPGHLTNEYNSGKRTSYIFPVRLYLLSSLLFFFTFTVSNLIDESSKEDAESAFIKNEVDSLKSIFGQYKEGDLSKSDEYFIEDVSDRFDLLKDSKPDKDEYLLKQYLGRNTNLSKSEQQIFVKDFAKKFDFDFRGYYENQDFIYDSINVFLNNHQYANEFNYLNSFTDTLFNQYKIKIPIEDKVYTVENLDEVEIADSALSSQFSNFIERKAEKLKLYGSSAGSILAKEMVNQIPKAVFLLVPIFALLLKLFYLRKGMFYINHLIFSFHIHSIFFIYFILTILVSEWYVYLIAIGLITLHIFLAMKRVYGQSKIKTFVKMFLLGGIYSFCVLLAALGVLLFSIINL